MPKRFPKKLINTSIIRINVTAIKKNTKTKSDFSQIQYDNYYDKNH